MSMSEYKSTSLLTSNSKFQGEIGALPAASMVGFIYVKNHVSKLREMDPQPNKSAQ